MPRPDTAPLSALSIDKPINVRKTGLGAEPTYVASIRAKGVIEPLTVRPNGKGFKITNGGKRYAALQWMSERGESAKGVPVTADYPVPINVRQESDREARDTSLMTNIIRAGMHPVDEYEAFVELEKGGDKPADIAARYGLTERHVNQRLALGKLSPKIRQAWRDGDIDAQTAMAYTLAPTAKDQERVYESLRKSGWGGAHSVRQKFTAKQADVGKLVQFVGVEALRAAGVKIEEDLFGISHRAADPKAVKAAADAKLEDECKRLVEAGWGWAVTSNDPSVRDSYYWPTIGNRPRKATPAEQNRINQLEDALDGSRDSDRDEAIQDEIDQISAAIDERRYTAGEKAKAGCIVSIGNNGELSVRYGLLKPSEARKVKAEEKKKETKRKGQDPSEPDIAGAVVWDLEVMLTHAAAAAIVAQPDLALQFCLVGLLTQGYGGTCIKIRNDGLASREQERNLKLDAAVAAVQKMTPAERMTELARHIGAAFSFTHHNKDRRPLKDERDVIYVCNAIDGSNLNKELRFQFDGGSNFFPRVASALILKAIEEAVSPEEARRVAKLKKKDIVAFALENVGKTGWLPPELRTVHYDGPGAKSAPKAEKPAKASRKKAA